MLVEIIIEIALLRRCNTPTCILDKHGEKCVAPTEQKMGIVSFFYQHVAPMGQVIKIWVHGSALRERCQKVATTERGGI
jgi:hypothetical protein